MAKKIKRDINDPIELEVLKQNAQLGNVPNVTTNNQTPTWSMVTSLSNIVSGETLTTIMGKISKAINDIISHIGNKNNPHSVTKSQVGLGNVENKSGVTIRSEMTKDEVINALGYTPPTTDTKYSVATSSTLGLIKSGTDITVDSSGNVSVNDDSHNHIIANIDNLQDVLDNKSDIYSYYTTSTFTSGWYKIKIKSTKSYMVSFTVRIYQNYNYTDVIISGYNYPSQNSWYSPKANIITSNLNSIQIKFGYDSKNLLWVAIPAQSYSGITICNINNGYTQVENWSENIQINYENELSGTITNTIDAYRPWHFNETVSKATSATKLATARKIAGVSFDGTEDISISYNNLTDKPTIPSGVQVIDNLTSSSTTASLSANQGRILKGYLDKKVVVSSSQPSGQQTGDTWYQII